MAVRRKRPPRPRDDHSTRITTLAALGMGGGDLGDAARVIADRARELAAWSVQIPPRIRVDVSEQVATISCDAPPAYPGETRARHPLYGNRHYWYGPPGEPFLSPAADEAGDQAMVKYARKIDRWAKDAGFK